MESKRVAELDGLRAIALLLVMAWHFVGIPDGPEFWLWKLLNVGRFGGDLFFVLSGYLITGILLNNRGSPAYFSSFYGRRACRIFPVYFAMCLLWLAVRTTGRFPDITNPQGVAGWSYFVGLQNLSMAWARTDGAYWLAGTWSLAIEEQFYLLFPLIVRHVPPDRTLRNLLLVPIIICPIGRLIDAPLDDPYGYYVLPQFRADSLAIGALIAWHQFSGTPVPTAERWFKIVALSLPLLWLFGGSRWSVAFSHTIAAWFFGLALSVTLDNQGGARTAFLRGPVLKFVADRSYAAYLTHHLVGYFLFAGTGVRRTMSTLSGTAMTAAAVILTFVLCSLSLRYVERPLIRYGHRRFRF